MASLLRSIAERWRDNAVLIDPTTGVPFARVFTGRVPQTELYKFPYVSILVSQGYSRKRTDKTRYSHSPVTFHLWVDEDHLEFAETLAAKIADAYADTCWKLTETDKVIDFLDEGEPLVHQTNLPNVKAWEVVKLFTAVIERARVDRDAECCVETPAADESDADLD